MAAETYILIKLWVCIYNKGQKKNQCIFCNFKTMGRLYRLLLYLRCADLKNENDFYFYGHNFSESGIPVFSYFSLYTT